MEIEVVGAVFDERIDLSERALVNQQIDPLAGCQPALLVLRLNSRGATAQP